MKKYLLFIAALLLIWGISPPIRAEAAGVSGSGSTPAQVGFVEGPNSPKPSTPPSSSTPPHGTSPSTPSHPGGSLPDTGDAGGLILIGIGLSMFLVAGTVLLFTKNKYKKEIKS